MSSFFFPFGFFFFSIRSPGPPEKPLSAAKSFTSETLVGREFLCTYIFIYIRTRISDPWHPYNRGFLFPSRPVSPSYTRRRCRRFYVHSDMYTGAPPEEEEEGRGGGDGTVESTARILLYWPNLIRR